METRGTHIADPWDRRLARWLIAPLTRTRLHPNHFTTLTLILGLASAWVFALPGREWDWLAAALFMAAVLSDHLDGEFARATGKQSELGHRYDFIVGGVNYTVLFIGIGIGLYYEYGMPALILGLLGGLANPFTLYMRMTMDQELGSEAVQHPAWGGFEIEDFVYLIGPLTWIFTVIVFFVPFALGSFGYMLWTASKFLKARSAAKQG